MTVAGLAIALRRRAAYVVAVLATLLIVLAPGGDPEPVLGASGGALGGAIGTPGPSGPAESEGAVGPAASDFGGSPSGATGGGAAGPGGGSTGAGERASAAAGPTGAGLNSPAAMAAPDCDPARKRLKVSYTYAPACAVPWPDGADNGGATHPGVTADTIKVLVYLAANETTRENDALTQVRDAAAPFEHFFRLWGRKVEWGVFRAAGPDEVAQRADVLKIAALKPFALINVLSNQFVLEGELARRGIITMNNAFVSVKDSLTWAPHVWGTILHPDELVALNTANYVGRRLSGRPAKWAGQAEYQVTTRKFGLAYPDSWDARALKIFQDAFAGYGAKLTDAISYRYGTTPDGIASWNERARLVVARFKSKGVTSVITATDFIFLTPFTNEASKQQWFPEWIMTGFAGQDLDTFARAFDQLQWRHAFGIGALGMFGAKPTPAGHFCFWYWGEGTSHNCTSRLATSYVPHLYTGLHGAGPRLTPETFRDGMFALPPAGGAASGAVMAPQMSFGQWGFFPWDTYNAYNDFTEAWWDPTANGRDSATGAQAVGKYRYLNGGRRYLPMAWPDAEPAMFDTAGTAMYHEDYPPGDRPPSYPCPDCPSSGGGG